MLHCCTLLMIKRFLVIQFEDLIGDRNYKSQVALVSKPHNSTKLDPGCYGESEQTIEDSPHQPRVLAAFRLDRFRGPNGQTRENPLLDCHSTLTLRTRNLLALAARTPLCIRSQIILLAAVSQILNRKPETPTP